MESWICPHAFVDYNMTNCLNCRNIVITYILTLHDTHLCAIVA